MASLRKVILVLAALAVSVHASAQITPAAVLLPRQSSAATSGSAEGGDASESGGAASNIGGAPTGCDQGAYASQSYQDCANNVLEDACLGLSATPLLQCGCNSAAAIFTCYSTFCPQDSSWSDYSSMSSGDCDFWTLFPAPFTVGETISGNTNAGQPHATAAGGGGSGSSIASKTGSAAGATGNTGSQSTSGQPASTSATKNSGPVLNAPSGFVAALVVAVVGICMLF